jgi:hypothetical protein
MKRSSIVAAAVLVLLVCAVAYAAPQHKSAAPAPPSVTAEPEGPLLSGKVVETMSAGGYTYVCLEKKGKKTWVAVPEMKVTVGKEMSFRPGAPMANFVSKSLNRTFETIIFTSGPASGADGVPTGASVGSKAAVAPVDKVAKVEKAAGPNAYTVAEIYAKRTALNKKSVVVKGKVVKVTTGIMGKNWFHIQDGTGDQKKGSHNLVVTSDDLPEKGDVVTVKGTIAKNKDFGAGYKYDVIMEDAQIQR